MAELSGKRILMMAAASAIRNKELRQKLQLKYEIPIYPIKPNFRSIFPIPTNSTQIQLITVAILSLKYISRQCPTRRVEFFCNIS